MRNAELDVAVDGSSAAKPNPKEFAAKVASQLLAGRRLSCDEGSKMLTPAGLTLNELIDIRVGLSYLEGQETKVDRWSPPSTDHGGNRRATLPNILRIIMNAKHVLCAIFATGFFVLNLPHSIVAQDTENTRMLSQGAVSQNHVAFVFDGDLWIANRDGSGPHRLTSHEGEETSPRFSPDGNSIAFSGQYDGNTDIYIMPISGGVPTRLTYHPRPRFCRRIYSGRFGRSVFVNARTRSHEGIENCSRFPWQADFQPLCRFPMDCGLRTPATEKRSPTFPSASGLKNGRITEVERARGSGSMTRKIIRCSRFGNPKGDATIPIPCLSVPKLLSL